MLTPSHHKVSLTFCPKKKGRRGFSAERFPHSIFVFFSHFGTLFELFLHRDKHTQKVGLTPFGLAPHLHISWRSRRWEGEGVLSLPLSARYRIPWSGYEYSLLETQNVWRREFLWIFLAFQFPKTDSHVNFSCAQKRVPRLYLNLWILVYWRWRWAWFSRSPLA